VRVALVAALLMLAGVIGIHAVAGPFSEVRSSTGAWLLAHIHRIMIAGSYPAAAVASEIPNTFYNALYPALVAGMAVTPLGRWIGGPTVIGHGISAAAFGLCALPLFMLWRRSGGRAAGVMAAGALLFPPMVATASLVRYDSLAIALVLLAIWAAWAARRDGRTWQWLAAGLAVGLVYNTREFLTAPAVGGVATAWLLRLRVGQERATDGPGRRAWLDDVARSAGMLLVGAALGAVLVPVALRLSPAGGLDALLGYAARGESVHRPGHSMFETLYLAVAGLPLGAGAAGLALAVLLQRGEARAGPLVLLGTIAPFGAFLISDQQSSQYYLLAHVLVISGIAGLVAVPPWRKVRWGAAVVAIGLSLAWAVATVQDLNGGQVPPRWELHTEAWPAPPKEISRIIDWGSDQVGDEPVVVTSQRVENADSLFAVRRDRPSAFLFQHELDTLLPRLVALHGGREVLLLSVESHLGQHPEPPVGTLLGTVGNNRVSGTLYRLPGIADGASVSCPSHNAPRGACLQLDWNEGGEVWMRQRMLARLQGRTGLLRWNTGKPGT
jgi:hypothetical protein